MITLRPYQISLIEQILQAIKLGYTKILIMAPTGSGKTMIMGGLIAQIAIQYGTPTSLITVPYTSLIKQTQDSLASQGIASLVETYNSTLSRGTHNTDILIVDECHHIGSPTGQELLRMVDFELLLGFTATPFRLDQNPLLVENGGPFEILINGPSVEELTEQGYLAHLNYYSYPLLKEITKEYYYLRYGTRGEREVTTYKIENKEHRIVEEYQEGFAGIPSFVFCKTIKHAESIAAKFNGAGINAGYLSCYNPKKVTANTISQFKDGKLAILCACNMASEGVDISHAKLVIMARKISSSLTLYIQQCLDLKTEVLTDQGWKNYNEVNIGDTVAAFNYRQDLIEWSIVEDKIVRSIHQNENMVEIENPHISIRTTEGHNYIFKHRASTAKNWQIAPAQDLILHKSIYKIPVAANQITEGTCSLSDNELSFLGWFLTDGSRNTKTGHIQLYQSKSSPYLEVIELLLSSCDIKYNKYLMPRRTGVLHGYDLSKYEPSYQFQISFSQANKTFFSRLEHYLDKSFPLLWFNTLTKEQLGVLLHSMNHGDGSKYKNITWTQKTYVITCGRNVDLADNMQSLCVRRNLRCYKSIYNNRGVDCIVLRIKPTSNSVTIGGSTYSGGRINTRKWTRSQMKYSPQVPNELVWCITTNLGTIVTRRNGKVSILGNCGRAMRPYQNQEANILDLCGNYYKFGSLKQAYSMEVV